MFACSIEELKFNYYIQDVSSNYSLNKTAFDYQVRQNYYQCISYCKHLFSFRSEQRLQTTLDYVVKDTHFIFFELSNNCN